MVYMDFIDKFEHLFLPRQSNNHKARLLHPVFLFLIAIGLLGFQITLGIGQRSIGVLGYAANINPEEVVRLTNEKRVANGLSALVVNPALSEAARRKGIDMIERDYWAHVAPDGTEPWKFFSDAGYKYKVAGENLARDFSNPHSAVDAWMASSSHRENILSSKYEEIGVAVVEGDLGGIDTTIVVQFFGTPVSSASTAIGDVSAKTFQEEESTSVVNVASPVSTLQPEPTLLPTPTAAPIETPVVVYTGTQIQGGGTNNTQTLVSPYVVTRTVSAAVVSILIAIMVLDWVLVSRRRIVRVSGRSFAHISFLGMILVIILIARAGQIL